MVNYSIDRWREGDAVPVDTPFASVDQIREDALPAEIRKLEESGCNPEFIWAMVACSRTDSPYDHIVPLGKVAANDAEMAAIMMNCLRQLEARGIPPAR